MEIDVQVGDLAQRALADAFDQLIRIGTAGANHCHRYSHLPYQPAERLDSQLARQLIANAHEALRYAECQMQYLDRRNPSGLDAAHEDDGLPVPNVAASETRAVGTLVEPMGGYVSPIEPFHIRFADGGAP